MRQLIIEKRIEELASRPQYGSRHLVRFGRKIYSQTDEDGIIAEIFNRIGTESKIFVEFGSGDGLENNSMALLCAGWTGLWIEGNEKSCKEIRQGMSQTIQRNQLAVENEFITENNINHLISKNINQKEIDLLSVDIDGNDYHILSSIDCVNPKVIVIEYNAKFAPPILYCMKYNENYVWDGSDATGASLKFLEIHMEEKGYCLVACSISGVNAFFVRKDLLRGMFDGPFTAEEFYEPARYSLIGGWNAGHRSSYGVVENMRGRAN